MYHSIKNLIRALFWPIAIPAQFLLNKSSHLHSTGWVTSYRRGYPCRRDGSEIPWMTYPVISFLEQRLKDDFTLFEFGSGSSTIFYAKRVKSVTSVEYDEKWFGKVQARIPENVRLIYQKSDVDGEYCRSISRANEKYDVVIIDGRDRVNCVKQSIAALSERGVIVLDDSFREKYREAIPYAKSRGFRALDFEGLISFGRVTSTTTILYRADNCLDI